MNKEKWSESSKRSFAYSRSTETHYEDFGYLCVKCLQHSTFSAADQKIEYEEKQGFIGIKKTLCANCQIQIDVLREKGRLFQNEWVQNKACLKNDERFLCDWLVILEEIPKYGKKSDRNLIFFLQKLTYACANRVWDGADRELAGD